MVDKGNLIKLTPKKWQIPKFSSWVIDAAEFVDKVKDQVRSRQKRMSNVADSGEEHSIIWGMFMASTINAATFMGKNFMEFHHEFHGSHLEENVRHHSKIGGRTRRDQQCGQNWKHLSLIGEETVINLQRAKVYVFSDSVLCLRRVSSTS